ncbi:MAG: glycosyltransferase family 2 protein [Planctomycetota bacterium]
MRTPAADISVVLPVRNEVETVTELHRRLRDVLGPDAQLLFVDDGSFDGSREVLIDLARADANAEVMGFRRNYGKSHALAAGFRKVRGRIVVTMDADLQDDPGDIPALIERLESGFDVAGGWRSERNDARSKVRASAIFNWIVSRASSLTFKDINCGLKAFRREVIEELRLTSGYHRFLPLLAHWKGFRVCEVEVNHHPRRHGVTNYGRSRMFRGVMDLCVLLFLERFDGRPGRFVAGGGVLISMLGGAILTGLFVLQRVTGSIQSRYPLLSLGLLLIVVGVQFVCFGFFAELLAYHFRSREPREPVSWSDQPADSGEEETSDSAASNS